MAETKQYIVKNQENGSVLISEDVLTSIVSVAVNETEGVAGYNGKLAEVPELLSKINRSRAIRICIAEDDTLTIDCNIIVAYGRAVVDVAKAVQENVASAVENMTGVVPAAVNVNVSGIATEKTEKKD